MSRCARKTTDPNTISTRSSRSSERGRLERLNNIRRRGSTSGSRSSIKTSKRSAWVHAICCRTLSTRFELKKWIIPTVSNSTRCSTTRNITSFSYVLNSATA
eukprot:19575_5